MEHESSPPTRTVKNTFLPNCENEEFTGAELHLACVHGCSRSDLPKEARDLLDEYREWARIRYAAASDDEIYAK